MSRPGTSAGNRPAQPSSVPACALHLAVCEGSVAGTRRLLRAGADPNEREDREGWTPLHVASGMGQEECASALLEEGADPNALDRAGWTPLHSASRFGHARIVQLLCAAGSNPSASAILSGKTPTDYARQLTSFSSLIFHN